MTLHEVFPQDLDKFPTKSKPCSSNTELESTTYLIYVAFLCGGHTPGIELPLSGPMKITTIKLIHVVQVGKGSGADTETLYISMVLIYDEYIIYTQTSEI